VLLNEKVKAFEQVKELSNALSNTNYWMSTQTAAYSLKAIGLFLESEKRGALKYAYSHNGKTVNASTNLPLAQTTLPVAGNQVSALKVVNERDRSLFVRLINTGTPERGAEEDEEKNLILN